LKRKEDKDAEVFSAEQVEAMIERTAAVATKLELGDSPLTIRLIRTLGVAMRRATQLEGRVALETRGSKSGTLLILPKEVPE